MNAHLLVGRQRESALLAEIIDCSPNAGSVVLVVGDPGIGKSALLHDAETRARARGWRVLGLAGVEAEAAFPFAGLHQLVGPLLASAELLPEDERDALATAFGLADGPAPDPVLIAAAVADLLAAESADDPIAVFADDVQWIDRQTTEVLAVLARRASSEPLLVIAAARTGHPGPFLEAGFPELVLGGVDEESATRILSDHATRLTSPERERVKRAALGNPLALRELPDALRSSTPPTALRPLSLSDRLERAFAGRVVGLPASTRDCLLVAAVDSADVLDEILSAAAILGGRTATRDSLTPAESARLVSVADDRVTFLHPLIRSGVVQSASLSRVLAAHAALTRILDAEPSRQIRHRAQSILGPDDAVADALEANAALAVSQGALFSAISDLERSAQLTAASVRRGRRLLAAAELGFALGRADLVDALVRAATGTDLGDLDRTRAWWLRESFEDSGTGDAARVFELCDFAERALAENDPDLTLKLLLGAAMRCWWADTDPAARERVVALASVVPGLAAEDPRRTAILAVAQPLDQCAAVVSALSRCEPRMLADDSQRLLGMAAYAVGDDATAVRFLEATLGRLRQEGKLGVLCQVLGVQLMALLDLGDLERVAALTAEATPLAEETGQSIWQIRAQAGEAMRLAMLGAGPAALRAAAEAEFAAGLRKLNDLLSSIQLARGIAWLACGRPRDAFQALRRALDPTDPSHHRRKSFSILMFLADAAAEAGHREDALELLAEFEDVGRTVPSPILHVHLAYARAVLAADDEAEERFLAALRGISADWSFARAKTELAYGCWLRRQHRGAEALLLLRRARAEFDRVGAMPWADEARLELQALHERSIWPSSVHLGSAARTRSVQALVEQGLSDHAIARRLDFPIDVVELHRTREGFDGGG